MSKVITFSRTFPAHHPKAGQPTFFVEKIWQSVEPDYHSLSPELFKEKRTWRLGTHWDRVAKHHTIRKGKRWKAGDKFSPRVWSGKPYNSKQIIIAPDIEIVKVWEIEMVPALFWDECMFKSKDFIVDADRLNAIAKNDGLSLTDFVQWIAGPGTASSKRKPFSGQIICWNKDINY